MKCSSRLATAATARIGDGSTDPRTPVVAPPTPPAMLPDNSWLRLLSRGSHHSQTKKGFKNTALCTARGRQSMNVLEASTDVQ